MSTQETLFDLPPIEMSGEKPGYGKARTQKPHRHQLTMPLFSIDDILPADDIARTIWEIVNGLDMTDFKTEIKAIEGRAGRPPIDPKIHLALWILATFKGIGSARTLDDYCKKHLSFIWVCGGVSTNYHSLSTFRNSSDKFERLLIQIVTSLIHQGVVDTETWALDGMKVRANAGSGSFRKEKTLNESERSAKKRIKQLQKEAKSGDANLSAREKAAKTRAAVESKENAQKALKMLKELHVNVDKRNRSKKEKKKLKKDARASKTDPEAKKMKMADGGFRPAYNVQFISDSKSRIITSVRTVNAGNDIGQAEPMINQVINTYELQPDNLLIDGGYFSEGDLEAVEKLGVKTHMPIPERTRKKYNGQTTLCGNSNVIRGLIERMSTQEAKDLYKKRCSVAEYPNATTRNKGFQQFSVRGLVRASATSLLHAITHNIERVISMARLDSSISLKFG